MSGSLRSMTYRPGSPRRSGRPTAADLAAPPIGDERIQLPDGRDIDADTFYAERDARTTQDRAYGNAEFPVAVVLPSGEVATTEGQTALLWTCSMLRRLGRPFARTIIVAPRNAETTPYRGALHRDVAATLGDAIEIELVGADPFAPIAWRCLGDAGVLDGVRMAVWLGAWNLDATGTPPLGHVLVSARGWVASVAGPIRAAHPTVAARGSAAPAAIIAAAGFGVGRVYDAAERAAGARALDVDSTPGAVWLSLESGAVTSDPDMGEVWMTRGAASDRVAPWSPEQGTPAPALDTLTLVSGGALGGNAGMIVAASFVAVGKARIIDFDHLGLSSLNRQIGVGVDRVGSLKAEVVAGAMGRAGISAFPIVTSYETRPEKTASDASCDGDTVLVGVDQVITRLHVQADWPGLLVNGSTGGTSWNVSVHPHPSTITASAADGCVGCLFAASRQSYGEIRRPQGCAGAALPLAVVRANARVRSSVPAAALAPFASYPFASVSAAASMVAAMTDEVWRREAGFASRGARVVRASSISPENTKAARLPRSPRCRLLCGAEAVQEVIARSRPAATEET